MNYIVLSRKWRPKNFDQVVGQDHVTKVISNALNSSKISHSYLFSGPRGVGKTTVARILAKKLNDLDSIESSLDVIEMDGASNRGIDEIRDLKDSVKYVPINGKYKVFIIDEAHMLTKEAFNALLKTLEEPPAYVVFILATTENQKIPPTISSRCQKYEFKRISAEDILTHLKFILDKEGCIAEQEALRSIALKADGSLRDALSLLDKVITLSEESITYETTANALGLVDQQVYLDLIARIKEQDIAACLKSIESAVNSGISNTNFLEGFIRYVRNSIYYITLGSDGSGLSEKSIDFLDKNKDMLEILKEILNLSIDSLNSRNNLNAIELENLFFKFFKLSDPERGFNDVKLDSSKFQDKSEFNEKADVVSQKKTEGNQSLIDIYNQNLKNLESDNIRVYCVLEKVTVSQSNLDTLTMDCSKLSKYEKTLLLDNINTINQELNKLSSKEIDVKIIEGEAFKPQSLKSEKIDTDLKNFKKLGDEASKEKDLNDSVSSKQFEEAKEHPLTDIAINDYNGKIIK